MLCVAWRCGIQAVKGSPSGATPQSNSSFQAYGFGAKQRTGSGAALGQGRESASPASSSVSRRGSHVNVNITPTSVPDSGTPEIRKYTKKLGSDILCGSLWGELWPLSSFVSVIIIFFLICTLGSKDPDG